MGWNTPRILLPNGGAPKIMITIIIGVICGPQKNMQQTQLSSQNYIIIMRLCLVTVAAVRPPCLYPAMEKYFNVMRYEGLISIIFRWFFFVIRMSVDYLIIILGVTIIFFPMVGDT